MRNLCRRLRAAAAATCAAVLAVSCMFRPVPDPTRFYILAATVPDSPPPAGGALAIGLGPITMPGYLQHPALAMRVGTQIRYANVDRWAEPLSTLFGRALGEDLAALLDARVVQYPWYRHTPLDVAVRVDVTSFEADASGEARLDACWSIRDTPTATVSRGECASIVESADERGAEAQVAALGRAVVELAQRVASTIRSSSRSRL